MDKEKEPRFTDEGYSEKELDSAVDKTGANDQVKSGNIFDPKKKRKEYKTT